MATFSIEKRNRVLAKEPKKDVHKIASAFSSAIDKEFGPFLKAVVLYGSCTEHPTAAHNDIDVLVIVDDVENIMGPEVTEAYRLVVHKHVMKISPLLHINTLKLSSYWEYARSGDPVLLNMLRDGVILLDKGIFAPMQLLLDQGRVRPSRESIYTYYARTGASLRAAQQHILGACTDLYWAAIDGAHAALMATGEMPATPERVPDMLEGLVKKKLLDKKHVRVMRELYHLQKSIERRDISEITGEQYQLYWKETVALVEALRTIVEMKNP